MYKLLHCNAGKRRRKYGRSWLTKYKPYNVIIFVISLQNMLLSLNLIWGCIRYLHMTWLYPTCITYYWYWPSIKYCDLLGWLNFDTSKQKHEIIRLLFFSIDVGKSEVRFVYQNCWEMLTKHILQNYMHANVITLRW